MSMQHVATHLWAHMGDVLAGATFLGIVAHAVNTFPTPAGKYGQWFLGLVQYVVGQRVAAANTMKGLQTEAIGVPSPPKP